MEYITAVQEIDSFADLSNKNGACLFGQYIVFFDDPFKQFAALNSSPKKRIYIIEYRFFLKMLARMSSTYNSKTQIIVEPSSYASYNWIILGWCNPLMISISRSILRRSSLHVTLTNFAASWRPVVFSLHKYTVPYVPLSHARDEITTEIDLVNASNSVVFFTFAANYLPSSSDEIS